MRTFVASCLGIICVFSTVQQAMAARIFVTIPNDTNTSEVTDLKLQAGQTYDLAIEVDTEGIKVNTFAGELILPDNLSITGVDLTKSIINLWISRPQLNTKTATFSGAVLGGFRGSDGSLFHLRVLANGVGQGSVSFPLITLYTHNGVGTPVKPAIHGVNLQIINPQSTDQIISPTPVGEKTIPVGIPAKTELAKPDKASPASFTPLLGRQSDSFGGKWFISFDTTDADSGLKGFEVKEGDSDFRPASSPYILKDQALSGPIIVRAIDKSGNVRDQRVSLSTPDKNNRPGYWLWLIILGAIVLVAEIYKIREEETELKVMAGAGKV